MRLYTHTHTCSFKSDGITLVSLVVTIIILLILAGVTLYLVAGSNGILGRAANALDKNKVATAKEQVELALSDFQSEFFEGKYVSKTLNGEKKDYLVEKLSSGVKTNEFFAQILSNETVMVYEGENTSGEEVIKGMIQKDGSILWDDENVGSSGGNLDENNNSGNSEGTGGNIDLEGYENLKKTMAQFQEKIDTLEKRETQFQTQISALETQLEENNNTLDSILTSQTRKDVLYESSNAIKQGKTYNFTFPEGKQLSDYKMLVFYTEAYYSPTSAWLTRQITMVEAKINNVEYDYSVSYSFEAVSSNWWLFSFSIPNSNQFRVDTISFGSKFTGIRVCKVIGIY